MGRSDVLTRRVEEGHTLAREVRGRVSEERLCRSGFDAEEKPASGAGLKSAHAAPLADVPAARNLRWRLRDPRQMLLEAPDAQKQEPRELAQREPALVRNPVRVLLLLVGAPLDIRVPAPGGIELAHGQRSHPSVSHAAHSRLG